MVAINLFKMAQFIYQMSQPLSKKGLGMKNRLWQMIELYLINLLEGNSITKSNFFQITKYKVVTALWSDHTCLCRWQVRHDSFVKSHLLWLKCGNSLSHNTLIQEAQNTCLNSRNQFFLMNSMKCGEVENDFCYIYRGVDNSKWMMLHWLFPWILFDIISRMH